MNTSIRHVAIALLSIVVGIVAMRLYRAPEPLPRDAPPETFSATRAMAHISALCRQPHYIGMAAHRQVRDAIVARLRALGYEVEIQSTTAVRKQSWGGTATNVHNIIAIHRGTRPGKAVAIMGHYDSQPNSLGAGDNGSAVAAMLETARALRQLSRPRNDVIFLFTDAEEAQLAGSRAFMEQHPLAKRVGFVANFDSRGSSGPVILYEVGPDHGWYINGLRRAVPEFFGNSLTYEIRKTLPSHTDLEPFLEQKIPGISLGFLEEYAHYHSLTDSPSNLDPASLQHIGNSMLGIARYFGDRPLDAVPQGELTFFNPIGHAMVHYAPWGNTLLLLVVLGLYGLCLFFGARRQRLSLRGIAAGSGGMLASIVAAGIAAWGLKTIICWLNPHFTAYPASTFYNAPLYYLSICAFVLVIQAVICHWRFKRSSLDNLACGALTVGLIIAVALTLFLPAGAHWVVVPLLFAVSAWVIVFHFDWSEAKRPSAFYTALAIASLPAITFFVPQLRFMFTTLGLSTAPLVAPLPPVALLFLIPQLHACWRIHRHLLWGLCLVVGLALLVAGQFTSSWDAEQPLQSHLMACFDMDSHEAIWASNSRRTDEWNARYFEHAVYKPLTEIYPDAQRKRMKSPAPWTELEPPNLSVLSAASSAESNQLRLRLVPARAASYFRLMFPHSAKLSAVTINGKSLRFTTAESDRDNGSYDDLLIRGIDARGVEIAAVCSPRPFELTVIEYSPGLEGLNGFRPMPDHIIPSFNNQSFKTIVKKTFRVNASR